MRPRSSTVSSGSCHSGDPSPVMLQCDAVDVGHRQRQVARRGDAALAGRGEETIERAAFGVLPGMPRADEHRHRAAGASRQVDQQHGGVETAGAEDCHRTAHGHGV